MSGRHLGKNFDGWVLVKPTGGRVKESFGFTKDDVVLWSYYSEEIHAGMFSIARPQQSDYWHQKVRSGWKLQRVVFKFWGEPE